MESQGDAGNQRSTICLAESCLNGIGKIDPTEHIKHFLSPTAAVGSNFSSATVTVDDNFLPFKVYDHPWGGAISNVKTYSEKAEASRDGRKLRRATQSSGECFPRPCSQASAFSSIHKPDIGTVSEQADKIKRWIERTNPRFDSAKSRFERTNPRFDSEVVKTESKIGPTDSYKKVMPNMLNIKARP